MGQCLRYLWYKITGKSNDRLQDNISVDSSTPHDDFSTVYIPEPAVSPHPRTQGMSPWPQPQPSRPQLSITPRQLAPRSQLSVPPQSSPSRTQVSITTQSPASKRQLSDQLQSITPRSTLPAQQVSITSRPTQQTPLLSTLQRSLPSRPQSSIQARPKPHPQIKSVPVCVHVPSSHINRSVSLPEVQYRYVYRLLRDNESMVNGIQAKIPHANVSIDHHVAYGSRSSSQYISTSASKYAIRKLVGVKIYGALHNIRIVKIDLVQTKQTHPTTRIIDLTDSQIARRHLTSSRAIKFADNFEEVLIEVRVPPSAVTLIYQGSKSMIGNERNWMDI